MSESAKHDWTRIYAEAAAIEAEAEEVPQADAPVSSAPSASEAASSAAAAVPWSRDRSKERRVFDLPTAHKMSGIRRFHARGNLLFAEGQFRRAAIQYKAALLWYEYTFPERQGGADGQRALDAKRVACLSNLAACEVSMREWEAAEATAGLALRADAASTKALYRRALARRHRHKFELAQADIDRAIALAPEDLALQREKALLRLTVKEHRRVERAAAKRMITPAPPQLPAPAATAPPAQSPDISPDSVATGLAAAAEGAPKHADPRAEGEDDDRSSTSAGSVWTAAGDAVSGLTALEGGDDTSSVGGVSQWDGLGKADRDDSALDAGSGFGLATDWATWAMQQDGGDEESDARPLRVSLAGAPAMSFDDLLVRASGATLDVLPSAGVL